MMNVGEQLLGAIKDMERGQRGYMLTNDPAYLQAYTTGQTTLSIRYEQMSSMLKVQADEVYLVQLGKLLQEKQAEMSQTITLHDAGNQNAAVALVQSGQGRREMDEITHYISLIEENEKSRDWRFIGLLIGCLPLLGFGRTHY
jgi:CHASE3 domain sensor protein